MVSVQYHILITQDLPLPLVGSPLGRADGHLPKRTIVRAKRV